MDKGHFDTNYFNNLGGYTDLINDTAICFYTIDQDTSFFGAFSHYPSEFMILNINPCSLDDLSQCMPKEKIILSYVQVIRLEPQINYGNKNHLIGYLINSDDYYPLNPALLAEIQEKLIIKEIVDSAGFMFPKTSVANYTAIDSRRYTNRFRDENPTTRSKNETTYNDACLAY